MKSSSILSSLLAGGLLFGSAVGLADRTPPGPPPPPPAPPTAPKAPKAPKAPRAGGSGVTITIDGVDQMVDAHIGSALDAVRNNPAIPPAVRDKITKRLEKVKQKIHSKVRNGKLDPDDLDDLGEELEDEMEEFGKDMEKWGEEFGEQMEKQFGNVKVHVGVHDDDDDDDDRDDDRDDDDDDDVADFDLDLDDDDDDIADAIRDLGDLNLQPQQRAQIKKLRLDSDAKVAAAKRDLDRASEQLEKQLANPAASDAEISRAIDAVTQQEAAIRKARILAWHNARRLLDDAQRTKVQGAAKHKRK